MPVLSPWLWLQLTSLSAGLAAPPASSSSRVLLYVDPGGPNEGAETAAVLAAAAHRDAQCIQLWSKGTADALCRQYVGDDAVVLRVRKMQAPPAGHELAWAERQLPSGSQIQGVLCGSDGGLATAERLQHVLVPSRSNCIVPARRDKHGMNVACRAAGLAVAAQAETDGWAAAERFLRSLVGADGSLRAVLKPRRGQESVMVGMATSMAEARAMHDVIAGTAVSIDSSEGGLGVVVQEFLIGDEWVVDTVSREGRHKAVAVWRYSKGEANGAPFVNFYDELRAVDGALERSLVSYAFAALDALCWRWGPCHVEIKATADGPRLVEVNAGRWNGIDFKLVADIAVGYNAYDVAVSALLDAPGGGDDLFGDVPDAPAALRCHARLVKIVSSVSGRLVAVEGLEQVEALDSCVHHTLRELEPGQHIRRTVDLGSSAGLVHLLHANGHVVAIDYDTLRAIQPTLFRVEGG